MLEGAFPGRYSNGPTPRSGLPSLGRSKSIEWLLCAAVGGLPVRTRVVNDVRISLGRPRTNCRRGFPW
jgi:hypothetical protein